MPNAVGSMYATWTDPDGDEWLLSEPGDESGWFTTSGPAGWGAPPYELVTDPLARGGVNLRFVRAEPARITWPLHIWGSTHVEFVQRYRDLRRAFLLTLRRQAPGVLRVQRPDGTSREIEAFYEDGFGGEAGENWINANPVLTLMCPDPYWRDTDDTVFPFSFGSVTNYFSPFPTVSSSQILGAATVFNPGEVDAWPAWTITGPMTAIVGTNVTTGQAFTLTTTISAGQQITIKTDPPSVIGPSGNNLVGALNFPSAYLWPLREGSNSVNLNVSGAAAGTTVQLAFRARYEGS